MSDILSGPNSLDLLDERIVSLMRYWDHLRAGRPVPARIEVSPASIARHLSRVCILERPRAGTVRIRLAGATLSGRMGMELRGMPFRSLFEVDDRAQAMDAAETAIVTPSISILSLERADHTGPQHEAQMAILPLSDTQGGLTRAIALYSETATATPYVNNLRGRFQVSDHRMLEIPETGALPGLSARAPIHALPKTKQARTTPATPTRAQAAPRVEARVLDHHTRPVFQVIDGGRS
ncbi:PAS domain-containing protein [Gymnodinialimonas ulvae]|uniref:PAS domain-containing protein n=1 Tax=Gymnodinialimonas ulvae TaxID=3126504 RepID=UPI00309AA63F